MADSPRILIVEARFYEDIADELCKGAIAAIEAAGGSWDRINVPGAFEIPGAIKFAIASSEAEHQYDGFVALGCVIRGETTHYDYVCNESARGLQNLVLEENAAIGFGILTVENRDQAWARADTRANTEKSNKGGAVAEAALRMVALKRQFGIA